jgi:cell division protein FtsW (lipid II flippase)
MVPYADPNTSSIPPWLRIVGSVFAVLTLFFFMGLVIAGLAGHHLTPQDEYPIVFVSALGIAMSLSFLGGDAVAKGKIPFKGSPVAFTARGGIAVFVICFSIGMAIYPKAQIPAPSGNQTINSTGDQNTNINAK